MTLSSADLARFVVEKTIGAATRHAAADAITDTLAVMLAGSVEDGVQRLTASFAPCEGPNAMPGFRSRSRFRAEDAALLFGMAAHILDFDDVCMLAICHPTAPVLTALLTAAPWSTLGGADLSDAVAIGTEVMIRLGQAIGPRHYALGFHSTATLGVFGAAAAVARLRRLSVRETEASLAIAASLASGLQINFGSMLKSLHVGIAAANALRAISWVQAGVSSSQSDFLGEAGVLNSFSGGEQRTWPAHLKLGEPFALLEPGFERKRYACCYLLHKVIAIGIDIARAGIELSGIEQICVEMPRGGTKPLLHPRPATGMEALFSGPYSLLAAIADGGISLSSFTDAAVQRPHIQSRLSAVELIETGPALETSGDLDSAPVTVRVKLTSGATRSFVRHAAPGSSEDPLSLAELAEKWRECLARANARLGTERAFELFAGRACLQQRASVEPWLSALWEASSDLASASAPALE